MLVDTVVAVRFGALVATGTLVAPQALSNIQTVKERRNFLAIVIPYLFDLL